jgi:hypothetical protein
MNNKREACVNKLIVLSFTMNLGFSTGMNNPLFVHLHALNWLIANYNITYPSMVVDVMGSELKKARAVHPDLVVHNHSYIYGKRKLENPWSNFVMTSCTMASVGMWDKNIFPAYYKDEDYRNQIRYILGERRDVIGDIEVHSDAQLQYMNDTHLIWYMTDRNVSVTHGPLDYDMYMRGMHKTMMKVHNKEEVIKSEESRLLRRVRSWMSQLLLWGVGGGGDQGSSLAQQPPQSAALQELAVEQGK